jgi:membrane-bound metal-dependent hydrolase YbcI (DUF457 family)
MFIGHFAVAFAVKRAAPRTSLGVTFAAAQLVDMLWPIFLLLGWEQVRIEPNVNPFLTLDFTSYPWTHSLVMGLVWGALFGGLYFAATKYKRGAIVVALLVPSHWVLDAVVHQPTCRCIRAALRESGWDCGRVHRRRSSSRQFCFSPVSRRTRP